MGPWPTHHTKKIRCPVFEKLAGCYVTTSRTSFPRALTTNSLLPPSFQPVSMLLLKQKLPSCSIPGLRNEPSTQQVLTYKIVSNWTQHKRKQITVHWTCKMFLFNLRNKWLGNRVEYALKKKKKTALSANIISKLLLGFPWGRFWYRTQEDSRSHKFLGTILIKPRAFPSLEEN